MIDIGYLETLACEPDASVRRELASQIGCFLSTPGESVEEIEALVPIALQLLDDTVFGVRKALADHFVHAPCAPRPVVFAQIGDAREICFPLLRYSPVLTDKDLADITAVADPMRQEAIAGRKQLGPAATRAMIDYAPRHVLALVVVNPEAEIDDRGFHRVIERHGRSSRICALLLDREDLPVGIRAHLISVLSERLSRLASEKQWLSKDRAREIASNARDNSLVRLTRRADLATTAALVDHLEQRDWLTGSIILRAVCLGNTLFVAQALSQLSRVPVGRIQALMRHRSGIGLNGICRRAGLPDGAAQAILISVEVYQELAGEGVEENEERFGQRMIERILTRFEKIAAEQQVFLLDLMIRFGARNSARLASKLVADLSKAA